MAEKKNMEQEQAPEKAEVKYNVTIEDIGPCKKKITVEVPESKIKENIDNKYKELKKDAVLPGFRKGRAPLRLLEKRYGTDIHKQAKLELMIDAAQAAMKDNNLDVLGDPNIDHEKVELPESGPMTFSFEVEVRPEFDLPPLEGIEIEKPVVEVTDEKIDAEIQLMCRRAGVWAPKEGEVAADDQLIADVVLTVEGAAEPEKYDNTEIYVRKTGFVAGVPVEDLDQLVVGAKVGDVKKTTVNVPATFFNEQYRGKKVDVEITIKDVKTLKPAELNAEMLQRYGFESVDQLRDSFRQQLTEQAERQARSAMSDQVREYLQENIKFDLPADVVADQSLAILQRQYANMLIRGMKKEDIDQQMDQLRASSEEQAKEQLKLFFIMDKIAQKFEISVSDEEINGHIAQIAAYRGRRPEKMREEMYRDGSLANFTLQVREEKCIEKILEKAKITDVAPEKATKVKKKTTRSKKKTEE
ncbi:trigger factor [Anaerohalosphaeraceae bacterium U12dextr]